MYAVDACPTNRTLERSLQFPLTRIMMKIIKTNSKEIINNCQLYFGLQPISDAIKTENHLLEQNFHHLQRTV